MSKFMRQALCLLIIVAMQVAIGWGIACDNPDNSKSNFCEIGGAK